MPNKMQLGDKSMILKLIFLSAIFTLLCLYTQFEAITSPETLETLSLIKEDDSNFDQLIDRKKYFTSNSNSQKKTKELKEIFDDKFLFEPLKIWEKEGNIKNQQVKKNSKQIEKQKQNTNHLSPQLLTPKDQIKNTQQNTIPSPLPPPPPKQKQPIIAIAGIGEEQIQFGKKLWKALNQTLDSETAKQEKQYYQKKYNISSFAEQPFCIFIPSYNNMGNNRYLNNLNSILQQDYSNYHIIFIDDASDDGTAQQIIKFAKEHQISEQKLKIIVNNQRKMAMPNIYKVAHEFCKPHEIFMIVDGDDELVGKQVFKFFNSQFQSKGLRLIYSNFLTMTGHRGYSRPYAQYIIKENNFRKHGFTISHLRAFYTKLFTLIKQEDLKDEKGNWFRAANDVAMYMPILQMVHYKFQYFPEICYLYNSNTGLNNHRVKLMEQKGNEKKIKAKLPYNELQELFTEEQKQNLKESMNKKIPIKDVNLPVPESKIQKYGWEQ